MASLGDAFSVVRFLSGQVKTHSWILCLFAVCVVPLPPPSCLSQVPSFKFFFVLCGVMTGNCGQRQLNKSAVLFPAELLQSVFNPLIVDRKEES